MDIEEKHEVASQQLIRYIIGLAVFEFILIGVAVAGSVYVVQAKIQIPVEFIYIAVISLNIIGGTPIVFLVRRAGKVEALFWKEIAEQYGYTYVHRPYFQNSALVFQQGRDRATGHGVMGTVHDRPFRFFQYRYTTNEGKSGRTHSYCVFEVVFSGTFPHIYLNNTRNRDLSNLKRFFLPRISLPAELEKNFDLHGPKGYEIEVLEIFTPDLLLHLLDAGWEHDLELVDQKLYIFREKPIRTKQELEYEVKRLQKLLEILAPKLNRLRLTPIGDLKSTL